MVLFMIGIAMRAGIVLPIVLFPLGLALRGCLVLFPPCLATRGSVILPSVLIVIGLAARGGNVRMTFLATARQSGLVSLYLPASVTLLTIFCTHMSPFTHLYYGVQGADDDGGNI